MTPLDRVLFGLTLSFFIPLPLIEIWFALGHEPPWATALIDGYAALGDPLVGARTMYGRFVFVLHTFVYQPVHVALAIGLLRRARWTGIVALLYAASGLTTDAFWYWFQFMGPYPPQSVPVVLGFLLPYTVYKVLLLIRFLPRAGT